MSLLRSFPTLLFALVLLAILGLCIAQQSLGMLLTAGTLAALSWVITEGPRGRMLPRWLSNALVMGALVFVIADLNQNRHDLLSVLGRFAILLTLIKLYERRSVRDHAHLLTLSLLLMVTGCLQSSNLLFGVVLLLYAALGLHVLLLYQLYASFERSRQVQSPGGVAIDRLPASVKPVLGRHAGAHFRILTVALALSGVALSLLAFVLFPREVGADMFGTLRSPLSSRTTGFAWEIDLARGGRINQSRVKIATVELLDVRGSPLSDQGPLLLRGDVLDQYQGHGVWTTAPGPLKHIGVSAAGFSPLMPLVDDAIAITQRVDLNRSSIGRTPLFSIHTPVAVSADRDLSVTYDPAKQTLATADQSKGLRGYSIKVIAEPPEGVLSALNDQLLTRERRGRWYMDGDGSVAELAKRLLADGGVPTTRPSLAEARFRWNRSAAAVFTAFLHSPSFTYTTDLSAVVQYGNSRDPISRFLIETRQGHCEFFASGLVALCHSVGIPARVVVGYIAYDFDDAARRYNVHESSAHAWAEVRTARLRWEEIDPTPPASLDQFHSAQGGLGDDLRTAYEQLEGNWSRNVVEFDAVAQNHLGQSINDNWSQRISSVITLVLERMERVNMFFNVGPGGYIWMGIVASALVIAVIALITLRRRTRAIRRTLRLNHLRGAEHQRMLKHLGFYLDMIEALRRAGIPKPPWQPPLQFAASLEHRRGDTADVVREITTLFYQARYGGKSLERSDRERAATLVQELSARLR